MVVVLLLGPVASVTPGIVGLALVTVVVAGLAPLELWVVRRTRPALDADSARMR